MKLESIRLPETIAAPRTDPIYNCHAYLTKVPIGAIQPFIQTFTKPGEVVADFFAGSGMTGLAALTLNRRARLSDISVLGKHIATGYLTDAPARDIRAAAHRVMAAARKALGTLYTTKRDSDGAKVEMIRTIWSFTYLCPSCGDEMVYYEAVNARSGAPQHCPSCGGPFARRSWPRGEDVPVEVVVQGENGKQVGQSVCETDRRMMRAASKDGRLSKVPSLLIEEDREMFSRSGLRRSGMTETGKFFSPRNGIALVELWRAINDIEDEVIQRELRFAFTAILTRASMRYQWSAQRPLNAQNQTYYIAPVYFEWNVFDLYGRKVNAVIRANEAVFDDGDLFSAEKVRDVSYEIASAEKLAHLDDRSVDYVFTDPPFGSNIFYSDMSLFQEAWLGETTDPTREAVVRTTGKRKNGSGERYEELLRSAFCEAFRVLKPGRYMSVVFGNSSGRIWGLVQRALRDAGFKVSPVHVAILDKGQRSVKGLNSGSEGVVTVDLILTMQKPAKGEQTAKAVTLADGDTDALIRTAINGLSAEEARNPSHVYGRILRKAIHKRLVLDELHLGDVLIALRNAGYGVDRKTGLLYGDITHSDVLRRA
jgi:16S rRNA G966 N2-methylase RsmD/predicted RNA-binding Zn-ribbon protein involved in translation (DUF1610 family)